MAEWSGILIYIQKTGIDINPVSIELIGKAEELAAISKEKIYAVVIGENNQKAIDALEGYPIDEIFNYDYAEFKDFTAYAYRAPMVHCIKSLRPSIVLVGATVEGRALAPATAVKLKTGLTADCTQLSLDDEGNLIQTRPAYGGDIMAEIFTESHRPQMATVRRGVMQKPEKMADIKAKVIIPEFSPDVSEKVKVIKEIQRTENSELETAKIVVAIGRGVERIEDIELLEGFAESIGGKLGCSRGIVERGWLPVSSQIGLSGRSVQPDLLITFGVSGSVQFLAGIGGAKKIISVNTDSQAPIFRQADMGYIADVNEIVAQIKTHFM